MRRFQQVIVDEPSEEETIEILEGLKNSMRTIIKCATTTMLSCNYAYGKTLSNRTLLPDKAIDILDEAGAMKKLSEENRPIELEELEDKIALLNEEKKNL